MTDDEFADWLHQHFCFRDHNTECGYYFQFPLYDSDRARWREHAQRVLKKATRHQLSRLAVMDLLESVKVET